MWLAQIAMLLVQLAYTAISSRRISPDGFASYAVALAIVSVISVTTATWLANAAARRQDDLVPSERALVSAALVAGLAASGLLQLFAPVVSGLFGNPQAVGMTRLLSLSVIVAPFTGVLTGYLRRRERIAALSRAQVGFTVLASGVGAVFVVYFAEPWTLTVNTILFSFAMAGYVAVSNGRRAVPGRLVPALREDLVFAAKTLGFVALVLYTSFGPVLALGRGTSDVALSAFNRAQVVIKFPFETAGRGAMTVLYPHFRTTTVDPTTRDAGTRLLSAVGWVVLGPSATMLFAAHALTGIVLGPQWATAQEMASYLWVAGVFGLLVTLFSGALEAANLMRALAWPAICAALTLTAFLGATLVTRSWEPALVGVAVSPMVWHSLQLVNGARLGVLSLRTVVRWYLLSGLIGFVGGVPVILLSLHGSADLLVLVVAALVALAFLVASWAMRDRIGPLKWFFDLLSPSTANGTAA